MKKLVGILLAFIAFNSYGASAIASASNGAIGRAYNSQSVESAKIGAFKKCQENSEGLECKMMITSGRPGWGAIAVGRDGIYVSISKNKAMDAINQALNGCDANYVACKVIDIFFDAVGAELFPEIEISPEQLELLKKQKELAPKTEKPKTSEHPADEQKKKPAKKANEITI